MEKQTINFGTSLPYKAPKCKVVALNLSGSCLLNSSDNYGDANHAGNNLNEDDEYTYDL